MLFARFIKAKLIYEYNTPILFTISIYIFAKYVKKYNDGRSKSAARHALKQSKRKKLPFKREVYSFCFFGYKYAKTVSQLKYRLSRNFRRATIRRADFAAYQSSFIEVFTSS